MKLAFDIARRYLFGKKTINAINIITGISVFGISIGAAALVLILSVFNGFEELIGDHFNAFNPEIKITPKKGKFFKIDSNFLKKLNGINEILDYSLTVEEVAYFIYGNSQSFGLIKGVDAKFNIVNNIDTAIVAGEYLLEKQGVNYGVIGNGLAGKMGVNVSDKITPISINVLNKKTTGSKKGEVFPAGKFAILSQSDLEYVLISLDLAQYLIGNTKGKNADKYSAIEIKTNGNVDLAQDKLKKELGNGFYIKNRREQDAELMKIMNMEKWIAYVIVSLSLFLIAINLIGSLWMIVLDKKKDIAMLQSMGANKSMIKQIFLYVGILISGFGLVIGFIIALLFYFAQKNFDLIGIPEGATIIDAYPVQLRFIDFIIVSITVLLIGFLISLLPARKAGQISAFIREE